jgi:hypothetical protein
LAANLGTPANKLGATIGSSITSYVRTSTESAGSADGSLVMGLEFNYDLVLDGCSNVTVSRCAFGIFQPNSSRLTISGPNNLISQCYSSGSSCLYFNQGGAFSGTRIENNIMPSYSFYVGVSGTAYVSLRNNLLYSFGESSSGVTLQADNNIFLSAISYIYGSSTSSSSSAVFRNNIFPGTPSGLTGSGNLTGVNLTSVMPAYQNSSASFDGRYKLSPLDGTNPALNAGTDGTHIGPFGGPNPYILSGIPPLPTIDELSVPTFAAPGGNVTIRVKVGARP